MHILHILLLTISVVLVASVRNVKFSPVPNSASDSSTDTETGAKEIQQLVNLPMTNFRAARTWSSWSSASAGSRSLRRGKLLNLHKG